MTMKIVVGLLVAIALTAPIVMEAMAEKKNVQNNIHSHYSTNNGEGNEKDNSNFGVVSNGPDGHINCSVDKNGEQKGNC